jgi:N-acyl amino acid synthase of PEP-CTERM/exosortase system
MDALIETFDKYFEVVPVETDDQLRQVFQLRYQVYCLETGYEDIEQHSSGLEQDEFDARAVHSLLIHRPSGLVAGTVRLVLPNPLNLDEPFPIEKHCGAAIKQPIKGANRAELAEISRFCISKEFKRRVAEAETLWANTREDTPLMEKLAQRRLIPHITIGLFTAIVRMSSDHGVRYWYAVMEPSLLRFLQRFGIHFESIGPLVDYHGERQPCFALADQVLGNMRHEAYAVWELITDRGVQWPLPTGKEKRKRQGKDGKPRGDVDKVTEAQG